MTAPLHTFELVRPRTVADAVAERYQHANSSFIAGGTDLIVNMRRGLVNSELLIDITGIDELHSMENGSSGLRVGAGVTIAALAGDPLISKTYRAIAQAAQAVAGPGHRAMATLGGNLCLDTRCIFYNQSEWWRRSNAFCLKRNGDTCHVAPQGQRCHAAFTGDLAPALLVVGAELEIAGLQGRRRAHLSDLYAEDGRMHRTLAHGEMIVAVHLPPTPPLSSYDKIRVRGAIDFPLAGVAVALKARSRVVQSLRLAITGTNSRPFVLTGTEAMMDRTVDDKLLKEIEELTQRQVKPMRTTTTSAHYRRIAAAALARRLTAALCDEQLRKIS